MNRLILCGVLAIASIPLFAQKTQILTADKHNEYGLVYTLPITVLDVTARAERTVNEAGPFWQYAEKYIGTDKVVRENNEQWSLKSVTLTPKGVANTDKQYNMQFKPGTMVYISVGDDNMLQSINKEMETAAPRDDQAESEVQADVPMDAYLEYVDEDFISSQSSAKQAQMLAQSLMDVREAKVALTRGTAETMPTDGRQLELMLQSLARQEKAFMQAFVGKSKTTSVTQDYTFTPEEEGSVTLFRFSDFAGFVDADDYSGDPVNIEVSDVQMAELPVDDKGETKKLPKDAVIYIIPGRATVSVSLNGKTYKELSSEFAQFGMEFGLLPSLFSDRRSKSYAVFNPVTGGLVEIGELNGN